MHTDNADFIFAGVGYDILACVKEEVQLILAINRKAAVGLILTGIVLVILMFDTLFELALELIHVSFEFVEQMLDMLIEHIFHTDLHDTQVIVFYLMLSIAGYALYRLLRTVLRWYYEIRENLVIAWTQLKKKILAFWQYLPPTGKIKWLIGFMTSITFMVLWVFS